MPGQLEHLDLNNNKQVELTELQKKMSEGFFDKKENVQLLVKELKYDEHMLEKSFRDVLQKAYNTILQKHISQQTPQEQSLMQLYHQIIVDAPTISIPSFYKPTVSIDLNKQSVKELPIIRYEQGYSNVALDKLLAWGQQLPGYSLFRMQKWQEYSQQYPGAQNIQLVNDWVDFECALWALDKYHTELQKEQSPLLSQAGYVSVEQADKDAVLFASYMEYTQALLQNDPSYNKAIDLLNRYMKDVNALKKPKNGEEQYKKYQETVSPLLVQYDVVNAATIVAQTNLDTMTQDDFVTYIDSIQKLNNYSLALAPIQKQYPQASAYIAYIEKLQSLQQKHGWSAAINQAVERYSSYNQQIDIWRQQNNATIAIDRYQKYSQLLYTSGVLTKMQFVGGMYTELQWVWNKQSQQLLFHAMRSHAESQEKRQARIDARHALVKHYVPWLYTTGNMVWWLREGRWKAIAGMTNGIKMGVWLLTGMDDHRLQLWLQSSDKTLAKFTGEKFQSTLMNESPVKDGKLNLHFDNTVNLVWQQVANMIILLSGAGAATKGLQTLGLTANVAGKVGLMSSALSMQLGNYFKTWLDVWLGSKEALAYALVQWWSSAALELINPNNAVLWTLKINPINLFAQWMGQKLLPKFLGAMGKEIIWEIAQEELQSLAEVWVNRLSNMYKEWFDTEFTWADFASTAILTGLTTGIVSAKGIYQQEKISLDQQKFINYIKQDPARIQEYGQKLQTMQVQWIITQEQLDVMSKEIGYDIVQPVVHIESTNVDNNWLSHTQEQTESTQQEQTEITPEQEQEFEKQIDEIVAEADGVQQELSDVLLEAEHTVDEHQKDLLLSKALHKIQHWFHKIDTVFGGTIHHIIHIFHDAKHDAKHVKQSQTILHKLWDILSAVDNALYGWYEVKHLLANIYHIWDGSYTWDYHMTAEAVGAMATALHEGVLHLSMRIKLLDLRIKEHITVHKFSDHIIDLGKYITDVDTYRHQLGSFLVNYSHIPTETIQSLINTLPVSGSVDNDLHMQIVMELGDAFESSYYGASDNSVVDKAIAKIVTLHQQSQKSKQNTVPPNTVKNEPY